MTDKLQELADQFGYSIDELLAEAMYDGLVAGICTNESCDYTREVEPDQDRGYCENCRTSSVQSIFVLMGMI